MSRTTAASFSLHGLQTNDLEIVARRTPNSFWVRIDLGMHDIALFVDTESQLQDLCNLFNIPMPTQINE